MLRSSLPPFAFVLALALTLPNLAPAFGQGSATWQQRVAYEMDVTLHADRHQLDGMQRLTYHNNAPDTLHHVYYHLYFNAFQPGSMMTERNRHLPDPDARVVPRIFELGPEEVGFYRIETLTQNGVPVPFTINDTVMEVPLARPIPPGGTAVFEMRYAAQVPLQTRRSGRDSREGIDYSMSQWYPKIANYDERGWHADPYIGREFYAPYGTFDVRLTLPADYVVGATGVLQNPEAVGHGYASPTASLAGSNGPARADSLTWHFLAENVHDFAWAADPDYLHEMFEGPNGITYHLLYQPDVAEGWARMKEWVPAIIGFFSERYGPYPYPQFTVAQAGDGGMEYPMVNFVTGRRSPYSLLGVTVHEAAHEWFYGALGSNEADYAWMDEGFTSYASAEAMGHLLDRPPSHLTALLNVVQAQHYGFFERLNTPSDWFATNAAYSVAAYSGGEAVAEQLGYVISPTLRDQWLRTYFGTFRFRHPNPYDLEKLAEDLSGLQLDWFFDQFTNTERRLDYGVDDLSSRPVGGAWETTLTLEREDEVVMPVDVRLTLADGSTQWVNVPLSIMAGHKPVPDDWIVAEPWFWTAPTYTLRLTLPARVVKAEIDPLVNTIDYNRLNNKTGFPVEAAFLQPPQPSWFHYSLGYRPLAQYAHAFGIGGGLQARGQYLFGRHELQAMVKLWPQVLFSGGEGPNDVCGCGTGGPANVSALDGIDYDFRYAPGLPALAPRAALALQARKHLGILENTLRFSRTLGGSPLPGREAGTLTLALVHQFSETSRVFRLDGYGWLGEDHLASARATLALGDALNGVTAGLEVGSSLQTDESATQFTLDARRAARLGGLLARAHARFGLGADDLALHKRYRLGAASYEEAWRNDAYRTTAATFENALEEAHLAAFSSPGPVGYLLSDNLITPIGGTPFGTRVLAGSLSLGATPAPGSPWLRPLQVALVSGAGQVWSPGDGDTFDPDDFLADAGFGLTYDVGSLPALRRWTAQSDVLAGLRVTARFPVWVSAPDRLGGSQEAFAFRWLVGIEVAAP